MRTRKRGCSRSSGASRRGLDGHCSGGCPVRRRGTLFWAEEFVLAAARPLRAAERGMELRAAAVVAARSFKPMKTPSYLHFSHRPAQMPCANPPPLPSLTGLFATLP